MNKLPGFCPLLDVAMSTPTPDQCTCPVRSDVADANCRDLRYLEIPGGPPEDWYLRCHGRTQATCWVDEELKRGA
jgi:hypothetical protein